MYCTVLRCTVLHFAILHYTILHYTTLYRFSLISDKMFMPCLDLASLCFDFSLLLLCLSTTRLRSWNEPQRDCLWLAAPRKRNRQKNCDIMCIHSINQWTSLREAWPEFIYLYFVKIGETFKKTSACMQQRRVRRYANCFTKTKRANKKKSR